MGDWCLVGDYGNVPHLFIHLHLALDSALSKFSVWDSVYGTHMLCVCVCVCVLNLDHSVCLWTLLPQHLTPPGSGIYYPQPPISALVCLPLQRVVHKLPTRPYFTLGEEHRTRVRRLPGSHLWAFPIPQEHRHIQMYSEHMHAVLCCLICIWASVIQ